MPWTRSVGLLMFIPLSYRQRILHPLLSVINRNNGDPRQSFLAGCGKTRAGRGRGDFTSPHVLCLQCQHGDGKSPLQVFSAACTTVRSFSKTRGLADQFPHCRVVFGIKSQL